jgi:FkbM family methyltransferase
MRSLLRRLGVDVVAYAPRNYPHLRRPLLLRELGIELVLDGGASDGAWAGALRAAGFGGRILSIEPLQESFELLQRRCAADDRWDCRRAALGSVGGTVELHVAGNRQSSSTLPMLEVHRRLEPHSAYVGSQPVEQLPLDELVDGAPVPTYLKLDLQGRELDALHGAARTLAATRAIELELSAVPLYEGQALLPDVLAFLYARGFTLVGVETSFRDRATGDLLQLNGFLRR